MLPRGELRKELISHLRQGRTKRRKHGKGNMAHAPIPDLISIHERPLEVEERQYFPKGTDFNAVSNYQIRKVQNLLNGRPRKVLDWKSPFEAMNELLR